MNEPLNEPPHELGFSFGSLLTSGITKLKLAFCVLLLSAALSWAAGAAHVTWKKIAPLPDPEGYAGAFAGVSRGSLIIAGGANFPGKKPWEGGEKVWSRKVFILDRPEAKWRESTPLPFPIAYGASITCARGLVCIGGCDAKSHHAEVFLITFDGQEVHINRFPDLPAPSAYLCGAICKNYIYVTGGCVSPKSTFGTTSVLRLDINDLKNGWVRLSDLPGEGRILAAAGWCGESLLIAGGASLSPGERGAPIRHYLKDCHEFTPGRGWRRIADLPTPLAAAPSPMPWADGCLLLGGDDGTQIETSAARHRGFSREALRYDAGSDRWIPLGQTPFALATTPTVEWEQKLIVPGGEIRPGIRSAIIWAGTIRQ